MNFERPWETHRGARADLIQRLDVFGRPPLTNYISTIADLSEMLSNADVRFKEAERCEALDVFPGRARDAREAARRYNDMARSILTREAPLAVSRLRDDLRTLETSDPTALFAVGNRAIRENLAEWPLDVYESREVGEVLNRGFEQSSSGPDALCDAAEESLRKLDDLRAHRDEHNAVGLAILGGLCLLGFTALMIYCAAPGPPTCTDPQVVLWASILLIGGGILLYFGVLSAIAAAAAAAA